MTPWWDVTGSESEAPRPRSRVSREADADTVGCRSRNNAAKGGTGDERGMTRKAKDATGRRLKHLRSLVGIRSSVSSFAIASESSS
ncbi:hypothetical protein JTE90_021700 [Oedothorax gibbosus]|uniref:Uncharacterized protein n=1 Tax=Oedothorax gibbosus TaxID=931172 RepID=A0AAV6TQK0_9ARAC|nr:hypothetical protein JTE90_021700 [Oedothorax gibbosus]